MSARNDDPSNKHGTTGTQPFVCEPTADQRCPIHRRRVGAHNQAGKRTRKRQSAFCQFGSHVQEQNCAQPIETEALPHLSEEERCQTTWMTCDPTTILKVVWRTD